MPTPISVPTHILISAATELSFWLSIGVFLFVALLANTIAAVARTGERFSELSSDLLAIVGPDRFIRVNRACERILGYSDDEMTSQPWINLVAPEDRDRVRSLLGAVCRQHRAGAI